MTATNKPMTGAQLDELMAVAMRMQSDSEKMGERSVSMFAYAVQVAVLEIRETRCKYEELQSQNADMAVQLANADSKCREIAWIEGNEPSEYGRYWVRYETDVGPQYCSAKWMEHNFCAGSNTNIHKIWLADHSRSINSLRGVTHYTKLPDSLEGAAQ